MFFPGMKNLCAKFGPDPSKYGGAYKEYTYIYTLTYILTSSSTDLISLTGEIAYPEFLN